ncbi:hypothetical protein RAM80_16500 [Pseudomonas sp. App30]|uniref:hypothetical protein n=1 Tax=Pseudomonas sp. App30 TaxID=3068990 RepID=UPI003A803291
MDLPGHWSNHNEYTGAVRSKLSVLNKMAPNLSDTQLVLGIGKIQSWARGGLENGLFKVNPSNGALL